MLCWKTGPQVARNANQKKWLGGRAVERSDLTLTMFQAKRETMARELTTPSRHDPARPTRRSNYPAPKRSGPFGFLFY